MALTGTQKAQIFNEVHWNAKFSSWHRPPSEAEEDRIQRAARMIKDAIRADGRLPNQDIEVIPQGSYHNNTNVRLNSDMDLCVRYNPQCVYPILPSSSTTATDLGITPLPVESVEATARELKQVLHTVLGGIGRVEWGNKALKVAGVEGSRVDADVVPAVVGYWVARSVVFGGLFGAPYLEKGTAIYSDDGRWIYNFPEQHHDRGKEKNERTGRRYKRTVRILKQLNDELLIFCKAPSFLVESLVYNCPDELFPGNDWYQTVSVVLGWMYAETADVTKGDRLLEANGIKPLFGIDQPWSREQAQSFARSALVRIAS